MPTTSLHNLPASKLTFQDLFRIIGGVRRSVLSILLQHGVETCLPTIIRPGSDTCVFRSDERCLIHVCISSWLHACTPLRMSRSVLSIRRGKAELSFQWRQARHCNRLWRCPCRWNRLIDTCRAYWLSTPTALSHSTWWTIERLRGQGECKDEGCVVWNI